MKRTNDPRHLKRVAIVQQLFSQSFEHQASLQNAKRYGSLHTTVTSILNASSKIDKLIEDAAPQFPVSKIAKIDVAILRLAIFELLLEGKQPPKVIIDEAVELAKQFGGDGSPGFINGVLGNLLEKNATEKLV